MDADRFDALSRTVMTGLGRRRMLSALLSGTLASLLATLETAARPRKARRKRGRHAPGPISDEQRKKKKKKKSGKKKKPASDLPLAPLTCSGNQLWCDDHCEEPCSNGCQLNPGEGCLCTLPPGGLTYCLASNRCVDTSTDPANCGRCGNVCDPGQMCQAGQCRCGSGEPVCGNGACCGAQDECCNGHCWPKSIGPWKPCANTCCAMNYDCCNGRCVNPEFGPWTPCGDWCCPADSVCCNGSCYPTAGGPWTPCPNGDLCCGPQDVCTANQCVGR